MDTLQHICFSAVTGIPPETGLMQGAITKTGATSSIHHNHPPQSLFGVATHRGPLDDEMPGVAH
jgi:hypothetical protein